MSDLDMYDEAWRAIIAMIVGGVVATPARWLVSSIAVRIAQGAVRSVRGRWKTQYSYLDGGGRLVTFSDKVRLIQFGRYVWGWNNAATRHRYRVSGVIRKGNVFAGTWNSRRPEAIYHGTFQLAISAGGHHMEGKWLGYSSKNSIRQGDWGWGVDED